MSMSDNIVVVQAPVTTIATIIAEGPQGPPGIAGINVDDTAKVDKSVVYYDASANSYKADAIWTVLTLTDGGNF
jgi:hypothetical protein